MDAKYTNGNIRSCNALTVAICFDRPECVKVLLDHGADIAVGGVWEQVVFNNAQHLNQLVKSGEMTANCVVNRDDTIQNIQEEGAKASQVQPMREGGHVSKTQDRECKNSWFVKKMEYLLMAGSNVPDLPIS